MDEPRQRPRRPQWRRQSSAPEEWGELVIARSESGDVLDVDPQLYWEGIAVLVPVTGETTPTLAAW